MRLALAALVVLGLSTGAFAQATGALAPVAKQQLLDNNGNPCAGCLLSTFVTGTSTPLATYTDAALTVPNANPIVLDSSGRAVIYLAPSSSYKFVFKTAASVTLWTVDPVAATNASNLGLGEYWVFGGLSVSPITAVAYPAGATFDKLHAGTAVWNVDAANVPSGTYKLEADGMVTAGTLTVAIVNLTDGAPDTPIGTLTVTSTTGERAISSASITLAASGTSKSYAIKVKQSTGTGFAWGIKLVRIS